MGLFDWLRRRRRRGTFAVWIDEAALRSALAHAIEADLAAGRPVLLAAHFDETLVRAGTDLAARGLAIVTRERWSDADCDRWLRSPPAHVVAVPVSGLPQTPLGGDGHARDGTPASVHLADAHVLAAANERVERFLATLPAGTSGRTWLALDEAPLTTFAQPWLRSMMKTMGMSADAPIESPMVGRAIENALRKLARRAHASAPARSLAEWIERNVRA